MSSLPKCRRVKRPTILAKRSQLAKTNIYKKRSYKPLYEKLKTNNNALAKALSKEKQEYQYLFSQNIALTSEVQELGVACNKRDDIISGVLKNAKESLQLLITLSGHVTNTIASCQQVVSTTRYTPRKSTSAIERRESNRRLSGKSPARGVVQPMVSGHMITKPTINLSRLNIEREYRVQNPSNLSDIEETLTTPEQSPSTTESTTPVRISITRPLNFGTRRVDRIPERLQTSIRTSDENERSSGGRGSRNSSRRSITLYRSRKNSPRNSSVAAPQKNNLNVTPETQDDERLRSPRVALHDVSRLLQNSQSVNIRTLLSNSSDMDLTQSQQSEALNYDESQQSPEVEDILANVDNTRSKIDKNVDNTRSKIDKNVDTTRSKIDSTSQSPTNNIRSKNTSTIPSDDDDPLEGPSWLLNDAEAVLPAVDNVNSSTRLINARNNKYIEKSNRHHEKLRSDLISDDEDDNDDDDEQTVNLATRFPNHQSNFYPNDDDGTKSLLPSFVTRKRGSNCDNTDDFTLMWRPATKNYDYDENELEFPVLESPLLPAEDINPPPREPDVTTNVQIITTQNFGNITTQRRPNELDSSLDMSDVDAEILAGDLKVRNSVVVQDERSGHENDDDDDDDDFPPRKRKRNDKKKVRLDSASDSEWAPTPKRKNLKIKGKTSLKDPSSAKVVLQKLRDDHGKIRYLSSDIKLSLEIDNHRSGIMQREPSSDSEVSSNGSSNKFTASTEVHRRPRRQKAPKNLQEPSLGKIPLSLRTRGEVVLDEARKQHLAVADLLRELGIDVVEMPPDENSPLCPFVEDVAVVCNGTALIARPQEPSRIKEIATIRSVLKKELDIPLVEIADQNARLDGGDVLFTGREFFVGLSQFTNEAGARAVAAAFPEYPCVPIKVAESKRLKSLVSMAGPDVICVGAGRESQEVLKRIEREATYSYQTLTVPEDDAANVVYVNGTLIHRSEDEIPNSSKVFAEKVEFPTRSLRLSELAKVSSGLSSCCLLVRRPRHIRNI